MLPADYYENGRLVKKAENADENYAAYVFQRLAGHQKQRDDLMRQLQKSPAGGEEIPRLWHALAMLPNFQFDVADYYRNEAEAWTGYHEYLCRGQHPAGAIRYARENAMTAMRNAVQADDSNEERFQRLIQRLDNNERE